MYFKAFIFPSLLRIGCVSIVSKIYLRRVPCQVRTRWHKSAYYPDKAVKSWHPYSLLGFSKIFSICHLLFFFSFFFYQLLYYISKSCNYILAPSCWIAACKIKRRVFRPKSVNCFSSGCGWVCALWSYGASWSCLSVSKETSSNSVQCRQYVKHVLFCCKKKKKKAVLISALVLHFHVNSSTHSFVSVQDGCDQEWPHQRDCAC